ncbi:unnamed protein product [Rhizoctonia solani]|uniref:Uncharacterized protein n=1 Tax=Rhizoctonia solani TaxID=456999 RepID=A0A8H3DG25_9AGAM|nr:unnamed protein product [Rhizoctonia solani]
MNQSSNSWEDDCGFLKCLHKDPDSNSSEQRYGRLHQWRPISWNPFDIQDGAGMAREDEEYQHLLEKPPTSPNDSLNVPSALEEYQHLLEKPPTSPNDSLNVPSALPKTESNQLLNPGPAWVNLFYDLAWTATFSSLTQNGQFDTIWDTISYAAFFVVVWWLWASQVLYSINFYTDDWFHLVFIFLQMGIFGMLAATTRGFDITTYILHSPGTPGVLSDPQPLKAITEPEEYNNELAARTSIQVIALSIALSRVLLLVQHLRVLMTSIQVIALSIALSRVLLLVQHLRVLMYAHFTVRSRRGRGYRIPRKLQIIPMGLLVSTALFFAAWGLSMTILGISEMGAKLRYVLWGSGLIVEVLSHVHMSRISWPRPSFGRLVTYKPLWNSGDKNEVEGLDSPVTPSFDSSAAPSLLELPVPHSDVTLGSRLEAITTIILGEGINGIASTLYSIISAPGLEGPIIVNILCTGFIVYFLAFLYFEGPSSGHTDSKDKIRRKVYWLLLHLPFLLCIVLLLQGELIKHVYRLVILTSSSLGVKNQFLLTSFLSTARKIAKDLDSVDDDLLLIWNQPNLGLNGTIIETMVKYNVSWTQEYNELAKNVSKWSSVRTDISSPLNLQQKKELFIWHWRLSLRILVNLHAIFMGSNTVPDGTETRINKYYQNSTFPQHDHDTPSDYLGNLNYYSILEEMLKHSIKSARYIMALAGIIFILLGALDVAHSKPRDRFQCGTIISRFLMGFIFLLLLLLNIGEHQKLWVNKGEEHKQAGVFSWISSYAPISQ